MKNYAFIDAQNLYYGMKSLGWKLDYKRFRIYLKEKYKVEVAYLFMGEIPEYRYLYQDLRKAGYEIIFKEIAKTDDGKIKGNVDGELILQAMIDYKNYEKAVIVSSDGDFSCLVKYLLSKNKLEIVMSPQINKCSFLLRRSARGRVTFIAEFKEKLIFN